MCWFHVMYNIAKHIEKDRLLKPHEKMIKADVGKLHYTRNEQEYENLKLSTWYKWTAYPEVATMEPSTWVFNHKLAN